MSLRTLHICYSFPPDAQGGTEVYVGDLCRALVRQGVDAIVAAPDHREHAYDVRGLRVARFLTAAPADLGQLYDGDPVAAASFARLLDRERPDLVHQHAISPACSVLLAEEVKRRGLPLVFTYHTPAATCQRGTLLLRGAEPCDGRLDVARCTACSLEGLGTGAMLGRALAAVPASSGDWLARLGRQGGPWTALRMSSLVGRQHRALAGLVAAVDRFVVLTPWVTGVLRVNGVPDWKMVRCAHGLGLPPAPKRAVPARTARRTRIAHLGRLDPVKGTALLIEAVRAVPHVPVELDIYGVVQGPTAAALAAQCQALAAGDARIRFLPPLAHDRVVETLAGYDLVAVPSQWMETGPLVVLEAFAAGVPVLGSDLGGVADKVTDGRDGLLVRPFNRVEAWSEAIRSCAADAGLRARLKAGIRATRSIEAVAADMRTLYASLRPAADRIEVGG